MFLLNFFSAVAEAIRAHNTYHDTVTELARLSDRDLNDLGIRRGDIYRVAAESALARIDQAQAPRGA